MDPPPLVSLNSNPLFKVKSFFQFFSDPNPANTNPHPPATPDFNSLINCDYHDIDTFNENFRNGSKLIISSINVQSLNSKFEDLKNFLFYLPSAVQILALQETWKIPHLFSV